MSAAADASGQLAGLNCSENRMPLGLSSRMTGVDGSKQ